MTDNPYQKAFDPTGYAKSTYLLGFITLADTPFANAGLVSMCEISDIDSKPRCTLRTAQRLQRVKHRFGIEPFAL